MYQKTDSWHCGKASEVVSRNVNNAPALHFFPGDGIGVGVALTECMRPFPKQGVVNSHASILTVLPPEVWARALERPRLLYINVSFLHPMPAGGHVTEDFDILVAWISASAMET